MAIVKQKGNTFFSDIGKDTDVAKVTKAFEALIAERGKGTIRVVENNTDEKNRSAENFVITGFGAQADGFSAEEIGNVIDKAQEAAKLERVYRQIDRETVRKADKAEGLASTVALVEPMYGGDTAANLAKALDSASSYPDGRHIKVRTSYEKGGEKVYKNFTAWESKEEGKSRTVSFKEEGAEKSTSIDIVRRKGTGKIEIAAFAEALAESKAIGNAMKFNNPVNVSVEQKVGKDHDLRSVVDSVAALSEKMEGKGLVSVTANFDGSNAIAKEAKQPEVEAPKVAEVEEMGR